MSELTDLIRELSALHGVSGAEQPVVRYLRDALQGLTDACEVDHWGNIIATKRGRDESFRLIVGAHSDEIGFYVKAIDAQGFLRVEGVGGVPFHMMAGRPVRVGDVDGVLGAGAWHLGKKVPGDSPLYIDVGARSSG